MGNLTVFNYDRRAAGTSSPPMLREFFNRVNGACRTKLWPGPGFVIWSVPPPP